MTLYEIKAFTRDNKGGNLAGVVLDNTLDVKTKQAIAKQANYSETVFVSKVNDNEFDVSYYTPTVEVEFCGHATIAAAYLLNQQDSSLNKLLFNTLEGQVTILIEASKVFIDMPAYSYIKELDQEQVAQVLDLKVEQIKTKPEIVKVGLADIMVQVDNLKTLNNLKLDLDKVSDYSIQQNVTGFHILAIENDQYYVRNFAPAVGIDEESATGTSNAAMFAYLLKQKLIKENSVINFLQGDSMNEPSLISVKYKNDKIWVGGNALITKEINV